MLKVRLNPRFYIVSALLFGLVVFVWYGIYFLNANEILMEDNTPMGVETKTLIIVLMSVVAVSWTVSLFTLIRQMIAGYAFVMDERGIHTTATLSIIFALILVMPVKNIPYDAIQEVSEECGMLSITLDKSKIQVSPIFRLFVRKEFHFFLGYTKEKHSEIKPILDQYMSK